MAPLVDGALDLEARHRNAISADPALTERLTPIADAHRAHATELAAVLGTTLPTAPVDPPTGPPAGSAPDVLGALRVAEEEGHAAAAKLCATAPAERAALVGSIAAARATHVEVLQ